MMKLEQMKTVLEKGGKFEGINRKVQIKPTKWIEQADGVCEVSICSSNAACCTFSAICPPRIGGPSECRCLVR